MEILHLNLSIFQPAMLDSSWDKRTGEGTWMSHKQVKLTPMILYNLLLDPQNDMKNAGFYPPGNGYISHLGKFGKSSSEVIFDGIC